MELRGAELASAELLRAIQSPKRTRPRTIVLAGEGTEELRLLERMGANADVGGELQTHIILRPDARKIEVLEEFLHGTQRTVGIIGRIGDRTPEIHVKFFMIRHAKLLGISEADVSILRTMVGEQ